MHGWMIFIGRIAKSFLKIQIRSAESITGQAGSFAIFMVSLNFTSFDRQFSPFVVGFTGCHLVLVDPVVPLNSTNR